MLNVSKWLGFDKKRKINDKLSQVELYITELESLVDKTTVATIIGKSNANNKELQKIKDCCEKYYQIFDELDKEFGSKLSRKSSFRLQNYRQKMENVQKRIFDVQSALEKYASDKNNMKGYRGKK